MKQAQYLDSKTHMNKLNLTSRTEIRNKALKYLFLETPCILEEMVSPGQVCL